MPVKLYHKPCIDEPTMKGHHNNSDDNDVTIIIMTMNGFWTVNDYNEGDQSLHLWVYFRNVCIRVH